MFFERIELFSFFPLQATAGAPSQENPEQYALDKQTIAAMGLVQRNQVQRILKKIQIHFFQHMRINHNIFLFSTATRCKNPHGHCPGVVTTTMSHMALPKNNRRCKHPQDHDALFQCCQ